MDMKYISFATNKKKKKTEKEKTIFLGIPDISHIREDSREIARTQRDIPLLLFSSLSLSFALFLLACHLGYVMFQKIAGLSGS